MSTFTEQLLTAHEAYAKFLKDVRAAYAAEDIPPFAEIALSDLLARSSELRLHVERMIEADKRSAK